MTNSLQKIADAGKMLAEARTLEDILSIRDLAVAAKSYARAARLGLKAQNHASEIKIMSERKVGEWLRENIQHGGDPKSRDVTLNNMGVSRSESSRWQSIAEVDESEFRNYIDETKARGRELTSAAIQNMGRRVKRERKIQEHKNEAAEAVAIAPEWLVGDFAVNRIYHADTMSEEFLQSMPKDFCPMIFTDPPWNERGIEAYDALGRLASRILVPGGFLFTYLGRMFFPEVLHVLGQWLDYWWVMCAFQPDSNTRIHKKKLYSAWKPIIVYRKPGDYDSDLPIWTPDALRVTRAKDWHDWQQGTEAITKYIQSYTNPGELVIDPFVGGGTIPLVAKSLGNQYLGFDIDEKAVRIATGRLSAQ